MKVEPVHVSVDIGDGRIIEIETGRLARQANGSAVIKFGKTMLLATVVMNDTPKEGIDFFPLSIDYQEKFASSGRIPGGFLKREAKLSDHEVLICRLVDRALRPIFPDQFYCDVQVNIQLISSDLEVMPDALACLAASAAIAASDVPVDNIISEVRVAKIDGVLKINPSVEEITRASLDYIVAATADSIVMVEGESSEISEEELVEAVLFAHESIKKQIEALKELKTKVGKEKKEIIPVVVDEDLRKQVYDLALNEVTAIVKKGTSKKERTSQFAELLEKVLITIQESKLEEEINTGLIKTYFHDVQYDAMRSVILDESLRLDGRKLDEVRDIWSEIDYLPAVHGSAIFTRGETQSLTSVTLGAKSDEQIIDGAFFNGHQKFILHYNFPSFSTGEVRPNRGPGRREIGHGNLALRALKKVLPSEMENPYTIRVVSDILESNGSSSMATVCAGSLALMDSGVKIKSPVSGIAMGLISDANNGKYAILSDILGDEDHLGDMDFKVAGTKDGIVACQMDIKIKGLSQEILVKALKQAKEGRLHILNEMNKTITEPREDFKPYAPRIVSFHIKKDEIGAVIGPGGKVIQEIQKETGVTINISEEADERGRVEIFSSNKEAIDKAEKRIKLIIEKPEVDKVYTGKVKNILDFGAFVEILPGKDGLLHISEISSSRVEKVSDVLTTGDEIQVKLIGIDKQGKLKLSKKALEEQNS